MPSTDTSSNGTSRLESIRQTIGTLKARRALHLDRLAGAKAESLTAAAVLSAIVEAQSTAQGVAAEVQASAHDRIARVVSRCLAAVFDEPYEFRVTFDRKRGKTEARLGFVRDGVEMDPLTAAGGGVVDVAAFALRLAALVLARPARRRLVVLDEPFKFVSAEYRGAVRGMLEMLAEDMDVQFVIVTHIDELKTGTVIEVEPQ